MKRFSPSYSKKPIPKTYQIIQPTYKPPPVKKKIIIKYTKFSK